MACSLPVVEVAQTVGRAAGARICLSTKVAPLVRRDQDVGPDVKLAAARLYQRRRINVLLRRSDMQEGMDAPPGGMAPTVAREVA
jgi:hypothetical protein